MHMTLAYRNLYFCSTPFTMLMLQEFICVWHCNNSVFFSDTSVLALLPINCELFVNVSSLL